MSKNDGTIAATLCPNAMTLTPGAQTNEVRQVNGIVVPIEFLCRYLEGDGQPNRKESPGLLAMEGNSYSECHGVKSQHFIMDGHILTLICFKIIMFAGKGQKINEKRPGMAF